jgi:membrane-bound lytic murein transglycosylase D
MKKSNRHISYRINVALGLLLTVATGCSHLGSRPAEHNSRHGNVADVRTVPDIIKREKRLEAKQSDELSEYSYQDEMVGSSYSNENKQFKLSYKQKHFDFWKRYFSYKERARFERHLNNGLKYKKVVEKTFKSMDFLLNYFMWV